MINLTESRSSRSKRRVANYWLFNDTQWRYEKLVRPNCYAVRPKQVVFVPLGRRPNNYLFVVEKKKKKTGKWKWFDEPRGRKQITWIGRTKFALDEWRDMLHLKRLDELIKKPNRELDQVLNREVMTRISVPYLGEFFVIPKPWMYESRGSHMIYQCGQGNHYLILALWSIGTQSTTSHTQIFFPWRMTLSPILSYCFEYVEISTYLTGSLTSILAWIFSCHSDCALDVYDI